MQLAGSLCALGSAAMICVLAAALGCRLLRWFRLPIVADGDRLLFGVGIGVVVIEATFFLAQFSGHIPLAFGVILAVSGAVGAIEFPGVLVRIGNIAGRAWNDSRSNRFLGCVTFSVLLIEGLAAMAPLTGSDALHYHFATELSVLRNGFAPDFFLSHSFLTGQGHLLILLGLAFHSEKLALGLLYFGGVLGAAATARMIREWAPRQCAWLVALAFLLSPVVFWQISTAGAPDLWMGFFTAIGVLGIAKLGETRSPGLAAVCGLCAGITAGTKYTGCIVATSLLLAFLWETRCVRLTMIFVCAALGAGIWPYARNFAWTGDPVFPFALHWFSKTNVNVHALSALLADTGVSGQLGLWQILKFPFFAAVDQKHLGFWQFFGPLCLLFAPMFVWMVRRNALWRASLLVWLGCAIGVGASSGILRFLVPVFPVALAAAFAGIFAFSARSSRAGRFLASATVAATLAVGFVGLVIYVRPSFAAGAGLVSTETYLREYSPEYASAEFISNAVGAREVSGKTLVFLRHVYRLRVPYVYGDPDGSWAVDPDRLRTAEDWRAFLQQHEIHWVARAPNYPESIAAPLSALEARGVLVPAVQGEVSEFSGMRILDHRQVVPIVILQFKN